MSRWALGAGGHEIAHIRREPNMEGFGDVRRNVSFIVTGIRRQGKILSWQWHDLTGIWLLCRKWIDDKATRQQDASDDGCGDTGKCMCIYSGDHMRLFPSGSCYFSDNCEAEY